MIEIASYVSWGVVNGSEGSRNMRSPGVSGLVGLGRSEASVIPLCRVGARSPAHTRQLSDISSLSKRASCRSLPAPSHFDFAEDDTLVPRTRPGRFVRSHTQAQPALTGAIAASTPSRLKSANCGSPANQRFYGSAASKPFRLHLAELRRQNRRPKQNRNGGAHRPS